MEPLDHEYDCTCAMEPGPHRHHITGWIDRTERISLTAEAAGWCAPEHPPTEPDDPSRLVADPDMVGPWLAVFDPERPVEVQIVEQHAERRKRAQQGTPGVNDRIGGGGGYGSGGIEYIGRVPDKRPAEFGAIRKGYNVAAIAIYLAMAAAVAVCLYGLLHQAPLR